MSGEERTQGLPMVSDCHAFSIGEAKTVCDLVLNHDGIVLGVVSASSKHVDMREVWYALPEESVPAVYETLQRLGILKRRNESEGQS